MSYFSGMAIISDLVNWALVKHYLDVREREINNDLGKRHKVKLSNLLPSLTRLMCVCV